MNKKDIEERIRVCTKRANDYREVGKTRLAEAYENEKFKWEQLLTQLKPHEKDIDYKRGYYRIKEKIRKFIKDIPLTKGTEMYRMELLKIVGDDEIGED